MSDEAGFLHTILANPEDDTVRLVYADWLEEHGHVDRAAFIRIQVQQAQLAWHQFQLIPGDLEYNALEQQAEQLLEQHRDEWMATLPQSLRGGQAVFQRGFVEKLELKVSQLLKVSGRVWDNHPIWELSLDVQGMLDQFLALPQLPRIRKLRLCPSLGDKLDKGDLKALASTNNLAALRDLTISAEGGNKEVEALARCPSLRGLTRLFLREARLDPEALAALTASANVANLTDLRLDALRAGAPERARVLACSPALAGLRQLRLLWVGDDGLAALAASPHLAGLRRLCLARNEITPSGVKVLAATRYLTRLQILELDNNDFGAAGVRALEGAAWGELARLDLIECELGDEGASALAECRSLPVLRSLSLDSNGITAEGIRALARSPHLPNLVYLSLYGNRIGNEGAQALCQSQGLSRLEKLHLGYCGPFSRKVQAALRQRFGDGVRL